MSWDFGAEIHALANYDADDTSTSSISGEVLNVHIDQWLTDGAKEVIQKLPPLLKERCVTISVLNNSSPTLDLDGIGTVMHVTRENADSGFYAPCREIPAAYGDMSNDSTNLMYYATATDPVYWIDSNSSDAATLFVKPTPTNAQPAKVYHISIPSIDASTDSSIANFPDEVEHLVVLYAAIKAAQSLLAQEEDDDLYIPIINSLKSDYVSGLNLLGVSAQNVKREPGQQKQQKQMQDLFRQMLERQK